MRKDTPKLFEPSENILSGFLNAYTELINQAKQNVAISGEFHKKYHKFLINLSKKGWYINGLTSVLEVPKIIPFLKKPDATELNSLMIQYIKSDYKELKKSTLETFPNKKSILEKGFLSFEKKQYGHSILIFLTQTDSICKQITGVRMFGRNKNESKTKEFTTKYYNETSFISAVLQPLSDYGEINKAEANYIPGEFNRHRIIHGEDTEYDTETNGYKMISLIFYLTTIIIKAKEWAQEPTNLLL